MKEVEIKSFDELNLHCYCYVDVKNPKGVMQIIHGMQEYGKRYDFFAKKLNAYGYIVYVYDQRGHGLTAKNINELGKSEGDIFTECVNDAITVSKYIKEQHPNLPLYVFAHSFGSFVGQRYVQLCNLADKVILSGSTNGSGVLYKLAKAVANLTSIKGKHAPAKLIEKMSFGSYAKSFENGNWLTRDNKAFEDYVKDKYCGTQFPVSFYKSMFTNLGKLNKNINDINNDTEILLIAGSEDKVSNNSKGVKQLHNLYLKNNKNSKIIIYPNARHELINDTEKDKVTADIVDFIKSK